MKFYGLDIEVGEGTFKDNVRIRRFSTAEEFERWWKGGETQYGATQFFLSENSPTLTEKRREILERASFWILVPWYEYLAARG